MPRENCRRARRIPRFHQLVKLHPEKTAGLNQIPRARIQIREHLNRFRLSRRNFDDRLVLRDGILEFIFLQVFASPVEMLGDVLIHALSGVFSDAMGFRVNDTLVGGNS